MSAATIQSPPVSVRLSDDEAWEVLRTAHTGILTTLRRDGSPIAVPVWFVVEDRIIYVTGPETSKKFVRDPERSLGCPSSSNRATRGRSSARST